MMTTPRAQCQRTSSSVDSSPGCTLEDWQKWLADEATAYWRVHVRYYWTYWIFGIDPRKIGGLKKRDSLERAGAFQQTLEQRSSLWNWPKIKQEINRPRVHYSIAAHMHILISWWLHHPTAHVCIYTKHTVPHATHHTNVILQCCSINTPLINYPEDEQLLLVLQFM